MFVKAKNLKLNTHQKETKLWIHTMQKNEAKNNFQIMSSRNAQYHFGKNKAGGEGKYMYMYMNRTHLKVNKRKVGWRKRKISMEKASCVSESE